ncbi:MAG: protein kinase [Proteobacteria bacterium]|nr:protein kinase [Pseudomonadota bacterium]
MQNIPEVGTLLADRYFIEEIVDTCGETAILKCVDTRLEVVCAIKLLIGDDEAPDWSQRRENFIAAFRKQARLNHPNIIHVVNLELRGERTFAVMEAVEGFTLERYLETTTLTPKEVTELFLSIVDAVSMAHGSKILHKGISPHNIMLYQQDNRLSPRILNFGTHRDSRRLDPLKHLPYLSPEQFENYDNAYPSSDVYALCATMYFAFTRRGPCVCEDYSKYLEVYAQNKRKLLFPGDIPPEFSELIRTGLSLRPEQRFLNAGALLKALKKIGSGFHLSANLTIEASKSRPTLATVSPSQGLVTDMQSGGFTSIPPLSTLTPSQPIVPRVPTGSFTTSAQIAVNNPQPSSTSQSIVAPSVEDMQPSGSFGQVLSIPADCHLPAELDNVYRILRIDSIQPHAMVGLLSTISHPDLQFAFKKLRLDGPIERAVFAEGVRRTDMLSKDNNSFEKVIECYPEHGLFVMPDVDHLSLQQSLLNEGAVPMNMAIHIAILIAHAMNYAHQNGFVNGNLKPTNILFEEKNGRLAPVIYDFGQKLYVSDVSQLSVTDLPYIAPELGYNLQNTNAQADIYSFGMILIEMLIGKSVYQSNDIQSLHEEISQYQAVPNTYNWQEQFPKPLVQVIHWCTNFDTSRRYLHFSDLLRDLYLVHEQLKG